MTGIHTATTMRREADLEPWQIARAIRQLRIRAVGRVGSAYVYSDEQRKLIVAEACRPVLARERRELAGSAA